MSRRRRKTASRGGLSPYEKTRPHKLSQPQTPAPRFGRGRLWGNRRFLPHLSAAPLRGAIPWQSREVRWVCRSMKFLRGGAVRGKKAPACPLRCYGRRILVLGRGRLWGNRRFLPHLSGAPLRGAILWRSREVGRVCRGVRFLRDRTVRG